MYICVCKYMFYTRTRRAQVLVSFREEEALVCVFAARCLNFSRILMWKIGTLYHYDELDCPVPKCNEKVMRVLLTALKNSEEKKKEYSKIIH